MASSFGSREVPFALSTWFEDGWSLSSLPSCGDKPEDTCSVSDDADSANTTRVTISAMVKGCDEWSLAESASPTRISDRELETHPCYAQRKIRLSTFSLTESESHISSPWQHDLPRYVASTMTSASAAVLRDARLSKIAPPGVWHVPKPPDSAGLSSEIQPTAAKAARQLGDGGHLASNVTTLSINHFPIWVTKTPLRQIIDSSGFAGKYNYLYVPFNYASGTSRGHAFVNFRSHCDANEFFKSWHGRRVHGSVVTVAVSVRQGFEESVAKWTRKKMQTVTDPELQPFIEG